MFLLYSAIRSVYKLLYSYLVAVMMVLFFRISSLVRIGSIILDKLIRS